MRVYVGQTTRNSFVSDNMTHTSRTRAKSPFGASFVAVSRRRRSNVPGPFGAGLSLLCCLTFGLLRRRARRRPAGVPAPGRPAGGPRGPGYGIRVVGPSGRGRGGACMVATATGVIVRLSYHGRMMSPPCVCAPCGLAACVRRCVGFEAGAVRLSRRWAHDTAAAVCLCAVWRRCR